MKQRRNRKNPKNFAVQVRMTESMYDLVESEALKKDISTAELIRKLIKGHHAK